MLYQAALPACLLVLLRVASAQDNAKKFSTFTPVPYDKAPSYYPGSPYSFPGSDNPYRSCSVKPLGDGKDDTIQILNVFQKCKESSRITFDEGTFNIEKIMKVEGLKNVEIDIKGTLQWSKDLDYWVKNSMPMPTGFQKQATAFILGGDHVHIHSSNGKGTFDGNGRVWYAKYNFIGNAKGRPHQITFDKLTNSVVEGIKFLNSQMWTMSITNSDSVLFQDISVSSTNEAGNVVPNTDGADTLASNNIVFARWTIQNGDDAIAVKGNSSNILIEDTQIVDGSGLAIGSIGQYWEQHDYIYNVLAQRTWLSDSWHAMYVKTWSGDKSADPPPNGGGGGLGFIWNVTLKDTQIWNVGEPFNIDQCLTYTEGVEPNCDSSKFWILDVKVENLKGSIKGEDYNDIASLRCSGSAPCSGIEISGTDIVDLKKNKEKVTKIDCDPKKVLKTKGFTCPTT